MDKELAEVRKKELEEFDKKVVVKNKHFYVDSLIKKSHQIDKYKSIRKEPIQKIGLRLSVKRTRELVARQILAAKGAPEMPVSSLSLQEQYVMGEGAMKPLKTKIDLAQTPLVRGTKDHETKDFERFKLENNKLLSSKVFISPLADHERTGPKWAPQKQNA